MRTLIKEAKTVDEAIQLAMQELAVEMEEVTINVLEEPKKALLGLFGGRNAKIEMLVDNHPVDLAKDFIAKILDQMSIEAEIVVDRKDNDLFIDIQGKDKDAMGVIIGKRGNTLDSLQYLVSLVVNKKREKYVRIVLDTENYRAKREKTLIELAKKMADKARYKKRSIKLDPMNPYERRIIHAALQGEPGIRTHSEGESPYRRVVIEYR